MNQGPRGDCLMKKNQRSKISRHCLFKTSLIICIEECQFWFDDEKAFLTGTSGAGTASLPQEYQSGGYCNNK
jgi:hypothetical protein